MYLKNYKNNSSDKYAIKGNQILKYSSCFKIINICILMDVYTINLLLIQSRIRISILKVFSF